MPKVLRLKLATRLTEQYRCAKGTLMHLDVAQKPDKCPAWCAEKTTLEPALSEYDVHAGAPRPRAGRWGTGYECGGCALY